MEFQSEVKSSSRNGWKPKESALEVTCSKSETCWIQIGLRVEIFHRVSASGSSFWTASNSKEIIVRNIPPQFTEELCTTLDSAIDKLMGQCFSLKSEELSTFNKTRIHLPIPLGGLGVRELTHVRFAEFIGGVMDFRYFPSTPNNDDHF